MTHLLYHYRGSMSSRFSSNSEADASELLGKWLWYYLQVEIFNHTQVCDPSRVKINILPRVWQTKHILYSFSSSSLSSSSRSWSRGGSSYKRIFRFRCGLQLWCRSFIWGPVDHRPGVYTWTMEHIQWRMYWLVPDLFLTHFLWTSLTMRYS